MAAALKVMAPSPTEFERAQAEMGGPRRLIQAYVRSLRSLYVEGARGARDSAAWLALETVLVAEHGRVWQDVQPDFANPAVARRIERMGLALVGGFDRAFKTAPNPSASVAMAMALHQLEQDAGSWEQHGGLAYATYWAYAAVGWLGLQCAREAGLAPAHVHAVITGERALVQPQLPPVPKTSAGQQAATMRASVPLAARAVSPQFLSASPPPSSDAGQIRGTVMLGLRSIADQNVSLHTAGLTRSITGTWLGLVALSWVSLLWGGLISTPVGVGFGVLASSFIGIFAVPLWGTVFGFLGMNAARSSTMAGMGFEPLADDDPLRATTSEFARALGIPPPKIGTIGAYNAYAMGVSHTDATVALGRPLLETLDEREIAAVLGHELGHVVSGDMRRMMLMRTFQNATVWFAVLQGVKQFARWVICWAAELYILAFSRKREYYADAIGAALAGKAAMISALRKLEQGPALSEAENTHARFMMRGRAAGAFSTHPSFAERIAALENETYIRQLPLRELTS